MDIPAGLLESSMVVVAHADDECVTYGALLQRIANPTVVYCTDSAPHDPYFWKERCGSREAYAELRRQEVRAALSEIGVKEAIFLAELPGAQGGLTDQQLFRNLDLAFCLLSELAANRKPNALLTLAYEGGHPDHDSCNLLCAQLSRELGIPAYEAPIYTRAYSSESLKAGVQRFGDESVPVLDVEPSEAELERKARMCRAYVSQGDFLRTFDIRREVFRPMPSHDYARPPHPGKLNYEVWQWSMTGTEVCAAFSRFLAGREAQSSSSQATGSSRRPL